MSETHFPQPISRQIWNMKYMFKTDREDYDSDVTVVDTWGRIAKACANQPRLHNNHEEREALEQRFYSALYDFKLLPAGRINSGAGTGRNVTLFNCYVMGTIPDSLAGIFDMLKEAALTMQQGGGIGYDFSTLRPKGALVKGVESTSSGPLTFMDVWDAMCKTIMSAGSRRGAMMATMRCDHPDVMDFVTAKKEPGRLRNFNVSVLCTDLFMDAVANDADWHLIFDGKIYETIKAVDLWNAILENTYNYAEPGVIFIDRINYENNLWFLETIAATNPCGEQPLPPYGACLLGSVNLAKHVVFPFTDQAEVDAVELEKSVRTGVRLLDSVVDISNFPLKAQEEEAKFKRRAGLGVTGLADLLFMTGYRYGSKAAEVKTDQIMKNIAIWAYEESIQMAKEMGPAPCLESREAREKFIQSGFMQRMPQYIKDDILEVGIRNSHLLSVAPTGTISMYAGNVSSGGEPIFAPEYTRKVTQEDGTKTEEKVYDYAVLLFKEFCTEGHYTDHVWWKNYMATAQDLQPADHIVMQAVLQKWVDSSISKTVNLPEDISFEDFKAVYDHAYQTGCKGCTTYRPNDVTGSVLSVETKEEKPDMVKFTVTEEDGKRHYEPEAPVSTDMRVIQRGPVMDGSTYKLKWDGDAYYVTINHELMPEGWHAPAEIFINTKNPAHSAWTGALTRMVSAIFQRGGDIRFVADELKSVFDPKGGQWVNGRYVPSLVALIGQTLQEHLMLIGYQSTPETMPEAPLIEVGAEAPEQPPEQAAPIPAQCPSCKEFNMIIESGCPKCMDCGYSKCG